MEVKEAVQTALNYVSDIYSAENVSHIGLEEVEYDEIKSQWNVTVGFARIWDFPPKSLMSTFAHLSEKPSSRTYKTVVVRDRDGQVTAIRIREVGAHE